MHEWYIYSRRKTLDNPISTNLELLGFWNYCLLRANHKRNSFFVWLEKVTIEPWQFVSSVTKLAKKFSIAKSRMYRIVKLLEEEEMLKHEWNTRYSLFTIVNRSRYQKVKHEWNTSETQLVTNNNDNNDKEWKEDRKKYAPKVFMTQKQYNNSCAKWTKPVVDEYIESISYYITNVKPNKKYKSIPKTITDWIKKDQQSGKRLAKLKSIYWDPLEIYTKFKKEVEDMENKEIHEYYKKHMMPKYHEDFLKEARALYSKKQNA